MARTPAFAVGTKVHVASNYFIDGLRGKDGIVAKPPKEVEISTGPWKDWTRIDCDENTYIYWIEFPPVVPDDIDGAEIEEAYLSEIT